ncbi:universal stress protein [Alicyclobacillus acidiphilus]|uniref:universal stress protein n=1 Tax=Alicyclobacillus acidiphilus TaxID=182455 RepID=UPI000832561A|nr:universal stress protein [Alicyclobacillus acidiphilus]
MKHLLLATDGSPASKTATRAVGRLIPVDNKDTLSCVYVSPRPSFPSAYLAREAVARENEMARTIKEETLAAFPPRTGARFEFHHVTGVAQLEICAMARKQDADLVVIGRHGHRGEHFLLGSVCNAVLHEADVPVLVVPEGANLPSHGPKRILLATDGSPSAAAAEAVAIDWMTQCPDAKLTILYVRDSVAHLPFDHLAESLHSATALWSDELEQNLLEGTFAALTQRVTFRSIEGSPARTICHVADEERSDLVILGSHGHRPMSDRLLLGSVSHAVVHMTTAPALVVRESIPVSQEMEEVIEVS